MAVRRLQPAAQRLDELEAKPASSYAGVAIKQVCGKCGREWLWLQDTARKCPECEP